LSLEETQFDVICQQEQLMRICRHFVM